MFESTQLMIIMLPIQEKLENVLIPKSQWCDDMGTLHNPAYSSPSPTKCEYQSMLLGSLANRQDEACVSFHQRLDEALVLCSSCCRQLYQLGNLSSLKCQPLILYYNNIAFCPKQVGVGPLILYYILVICGVVKIPPRVSNQ
jgi:hypothetical protein